MQIRECRPSDYLRIYEINRNALGYEYDAGKTKERLAGILKCGTDRLYVACVDKYVIGYIHGSSYECTYSDPLKNILAIAVDGRYQGQGTGRALLGAIESWAKESRCCGVRLVSGYDRTAAHEFYLHCGYINRKQQKNFIKYFG